MDNLPTEIIENIIYHLDVETKINLAITNKRLFDIILSNLNRFDNYKLCAFAAKNGHLECLKYAHEQGCPWDKNTCVHMLQKEVILNV
jgi:hypothetical protein